MRRLMVIAIPSLMLALLGPGCVSEEPTPEPPPDVEKYIVDKAPESITPLNVNFDDKVTLLGVQIEPGLEVVPGKRVKLTMYWRADKPLDPGWKLFTHVLDGSGDRLMNIDNVGPLRQVGKAGQALPPSSWVPGKTYVDAQNFTVPRKLKSSKLQVVTGVWKGRQRLEVKSGSSISDNRALVATFATTAKDKEQAKTLRVPELEVARLREGASVRIDGKLEDAAWRGAADTAAFVNVKSGDAHPESPVQGSAKLLWDDKWLYVAVDVKDKNVVGGFDKKQKDPHLWTKDCVEIMVDPDGNGDNKDYYEIQINPQNLVFDSRFDEYNQPRQEPDGPFGHQEWSSKLESAVQLKGTIDKPDDEDEGYVVEARIPWASFDKAKEVPPKPGTGWRLNLYAMQDNNGVAWSPILDQGNFHKASRFGRMTWVLDKPGETASASQPVKSLEAPVSPPATETGATGTADQDGAGRDLSVSKKALQQGPSLQIPKPAVVPPGPEAPELPPSYEPSPVPVAPSAPPEAPPPSE